MAYNLPLPPRLRSEGWRVKISDKERLEPPHATVIRKTKRWRWDLRARAFMDDSPDPAEVSNELVSEMMAHHELLGAEWDRAYPHNPVIERNDA